ncbi:MAG: hypothetical protein JSV30_05320 [Candidatus Omnitrophota bacterium]|nr:MAG: hypothetical protein JSV30_05320 [Candidatus Omnitrophota bacterium]
MFEWFKRQKENIKVLSISMGIIIPLVSIAFSGIQYIEANKRLTKQKSFENYHIVIGRIGGGEKSDIFVAAANIFELRNYPEYRDVSIRILEHMVKIWTGKDDVLTKEIILTKQYLESLR